MVSPELFQGRLNSRHFSSFQSRHEMADHLIRKAIEDFFLLHKDEICNDIMESHDEILSTTEMNLLYKRTMAAYVRSAQNEMITLNRLDSQRQAAEVLSGYLRLIGEGDEEAIAVKSNLQGHKEAQLIILPDDEIKGRLAIIPLLLAKGLEFDAVILFNCIYSNEKDDLLRRKVYLGCTRALHGLYFVERDLLPDSLRGCDVYMDIKDWREVNGMI